MTPSRRQPASLWRAIMTAALALTALTSLPGQTLGLEDSGGAGQAAYVSAVALDATILGGQTRTRLELAVTNPSNRVRGGNLLVPLPADAVVMGYQLEVNGVLVDGVPVPKPRATEVYETIERRGTDPGLVEQAQGNIFRTRVFPIQPGQTRRVVLTWAGNLAGPRADHYRLPLEFARPVKTFDLKLTVLDIKTPPQLKVAGLEGADFVPWDSGFQTSLSRRDIKLATTLELALPAPGLDQVLLEETDGERWFSVLVADPAAGAPAAGLKQAPKPAAPARAEWAKAAKPRLTLYHDASWSRRRTGAADLAALLAKAASLLGKPLQVDLVVFRDSPEALRQVQVQPGNANEFLRLLEQVPFDGGSRFDNLPPPAPGSLVLFHTDALPTLGERLPAWKSEGAVVLMDAGPGDQGAALRLAGSTGQVLSLAATGETAAGRLDRLAQALVNRSAAPVLRVVSGSVKDPGIVRVPGNDQLLCLTGQLMGSSAALAWGIGTADQRLVVNSDRLRRGDLARFAWTQARIQDFMLQADYGTPAWKTRITQFGNAFNVVTPGTSLLVLETLDQYLEFDIKPPSSLPDWEKAWRQQVTRQEQDEASALESRIQNLASQWNERIAWWTHDYSKVPDQLPPEKKDKKAAEGREMEESTMDLMAERAPAPAMAERPALQAASAGDEPVRRDSAGAGEDKKVAAGKDEADGFDTPAAGREARLEIQAWNPDRPYLKELSAVGPDQAYKRYLKIRDSYQASPAFFLETGDWFARNNLKDLAWRIWSTIAELGFRDSSMLRILAKRLAQADDPDLALILLELVRDDRPFEPQSHRDLALVLAQKGRLAEAVPLLYQVATGNWQRTRGIEIVSLMEFNRYLIPAVKQGLSPLKFDKRLVRMLDCDLRIVLTWDADSTDQDLWVTEPSGFRVSYAAKDSPHGGHISNDITDGYGPEEYLIRTARKGSYRIETNFYGSRSPELTGAVTLFATIFTNYGRANEKSQTITLQLEGSGSSFLVGTATWD